MAIKNFTAEGVPVDGTELTVGNLGASGDAIAPIKSSGGSITGTATVGEVVHNQCSVKIVGPAGVSAYLSWSESSIAAVGFRAYSRIASASANYSLQGISNSSGQIVSVILLTNGRLMVQDAGGTALYTTPQPLSLPGVYGVDIAARPGTAINNGAIKFAVYDSQDELAAGMTASFESTTCNAGTSGITALNVGKWQSSSAAVTSVIDSVRRTDSYDLVGPFSEVSLTAVISGGNQSDLTAKSVRTLSAEGSSGEPTVFEWSHVSGETVTIANSSNSEASYVVPAVKAAASVAIGLRVGDGVNWSSPVTVTDEIKKWPIWRMKNDQLVASTFRRRTEPTEPPEPSLTVGSLPIGDASYEVPASNTVWVATNGSDSNSGTQASPYRTIGRATSQAPAGSTIIVREGRYHEGGVYDPDVGGGSLAGIRFTNSNVTLQNYPNEAVWLDGSEVVTGWTQSSGRWTVPFVTGFDRTETNTRGVDTGSWPGGEGFVKPEFPYASWPEQVFIDSRPLEQVGSVNDVGPGKFFVQGSTIGGSGTNKNYFTSTAYVIGDNPAGREVCISTLGRAMTVQRTGIKMRGIGFRHYSAALCEFGTIYYDSRVATANALLENVIVRDIANQGVHGIGNNSVIRHCTFERCGNVGFGSNGDDILLEHCYFKENVSARYNYGPSAGAIKITMNHRFTLRYNRFEDTYGHAFWADMSVYDTAIYGNDFIRGYGHGVNYEISALAYIVDNLFVDVAIDSDLRPPHSSNPIWLSGCNDVYVWNNTIVNSEILLRWSADSRDPFNPNNNYGRDPRMPDEWYQTVMKWSSEDFEVKNNIFYKSPAYNSVQATFYTTSANSMATSAYNIQTGGNLYNRLTSSTPSRFANGRNSSQVVTWPNMTANDHLGGPSWQSITGETGSVLVTGRDVMQTASGENFVVNPSEASAVSLQSLPASVASKVGRSAGVRHLGAWR